MRFEGSGSARHFSFFIFATAWLLSTFFGAVAMAEAIHEACEKGDATMVGRLVRADPSCVDRIMNEDRIAKTPMIVAIENNHLAIVRLLLQNNASVNGPEVSPTVRPGEVVYRPHAPLAVAVDRDNVNTAIVRLLLSKRANPDVVAVGYPAYRTNPLHLAARRGDVRTVGMLLAAGADATLASDLELAGEAEASVDRSEKARDEAE